MHLVKRFLCEITTDKMVSFLPETEGVRMDVVSTAYQPEINIVYNKLLKATKNLPDKRVDLSDFIDIKGMKALGNQLTKLKTKEIQLVGPIEGTVPWPEPEKPQKVEPEFDESDSDEDVEFEITNDENDTEIIEEVTPKDDVPFEIEWTVGDVKKEDEPKKEDDEREEPPQMTLF
jgi:topoisomerase-4 subunit A